MEIKSGALVLTGIISYTPSIRTFHFSPPQILLNHLYRPPHPIFRADFFT